MKSNVKNLSAARASLYALEHHAKPIRDVALYVFTLASMHGFQVVSARGGTNSWKLIHPDGRWWIVRGRRNPWRVEIGTAKLTTRAQAVRWFDRV